MDAESGISIDSGKDIYLETTEYLFMGCMANSYDDGLRRDSQNDLRNRVKIGEEQYARESLELEGFALFDKVHRERKMQEVETVAGQFGSMLDGMTFGIFTPKIKNEAVGSDDSFEDGVITLYGFNRLSMEVGASRIEMDTDIRIAADHFYWLGYETQEHEKQEKPYTSWWETILDGAQLILDIAGCIPVFGAVPDLISAGISLLRGDIAGAAMSAFAAIPLIGDAAGAVKVGGKVVKTVSKLTKAQKIMMSVQLLYQGAQLAYTIYQNRDAFAKLFTSIKNDEFSFSDLEDVNNLITVLRTVPSVITKDDGAGDTYTYDGAGRLVCIRDPYGRVVQTYTYDLAGNIIRAADANAHEEAEEKELPVAETLYTYNLAGWLTAKREPLERKEDGSVLYALTTYVYDRMGNLLMEKRFLEPQGAEGMSGATHSIRYEYDRSNRLVRVSDCSGAALEYIYGKHGLTEKERVRVGEDTWQETRYVYTPEGRIRKLAKDLGNGKYAITEFAYDLNGNLTLMKLPEGGEIAYSYDKEDRLVREEHRGGEIQNVLIYTYDAAGNLTSTTDSEGHTERKAYDLLDREILHTGKDGGIQATRYDLNGNPVMQTSPMQHAAGGAGYTYRYDLCNRLTGMTGPEGQLLAENSYDRAGNLTNRKDGMGSGVSLSYDLAGRRIQAVTQGGSSQSWSFDATGNVKAVTDGLGNRTEFILDKWGRITGVKKADGSVENYTYDYAGNMLSSTDGEGHTVHMEYDVLGRMVKRTDALGAAETFAYDKSGRLCQSTDRNGTTMRLSYNMYGSLTSRTAETADGSSRVTESFGYYPDGKLKSAIGGGMRYDYAYDSMGRLLSKSASGRTLLSYTYDLNGNRTSMTDVTGKCTGYRYNSLDQLLEITDNGKVQARYQYNGDGTIRRLEVGNSLITEFGYDVDKNIISQKTMMLGMEEVSNPLGKLTGLQPQAPSSTNPLKPTVLVDNTYAYDSNANRIEKHTLAGLNNFTYDSVNRLVKAEYPTGAEEYRYDRAGNRTAKIWKGADAASGMEEKYYYDSSNRLTRHDILPADLSKTQEIRCYSYDAQGNMLSDGNRQFVYDAMNRLSEARNEDGTHQKNYYDGEGLRAELEENGRLVSFIFDGDRVVNEKDTENTIRYIRGYELISSDSEKARTYYHYACDEMGSITHVTDEEGSVLNRYEYDAFGDCTYKEETVANRFGFAGEQYDPVAGMYYLRARFYNPVIGRFIQEDTYYGDGLNLYAYCHNNPVGYVDPSGNAADCINKQMALQYLHEQHPRWKEKRLRKEYDRLKDVYGENGQRADARVVRRRLEEEYGYRGNESGKTSSGLPDWLKARFEAGNNFNKENRPRYPYNEVEVYGDGKNYVVDSYIPGSEIVSRKFTQLASVQESTGIGYLNELQKKYPSGAIITDSPFNPKVLRGKTMTGNLILEIPEQKGSIPQSVIDYANSKGIIIRDVNGKEYN